MKFKMFNFILFFINLNNCNHFYFLFSCVLIVVNYCGAFGRSRSFSDARDHSCVSRDYG